MTAIPVVFVHGLWLHASSWQPWLELFACAGYEPVAPLWPGEHETVAATRADPGSLGARGIDDVAEHLAGVIAALPAPPVLVGHSFGGMLVEKLLAQGRGRAGIAIDAAQIKGVLPLPLSALRSAFPVLRDPANKHRAVSLTADQFHYAFGNAIDRAESDRLYERWAIAAPGRPLFEAAAANVSRHSPAAVDTRNNDRGPLLLVMGGKDHTVCLWELGVMFHKQRERRAEAVEVLSEALDLVRAHGVTTSSRTSSRSCASACWSGIARTGLSRWSTSSWTSPATARPPIPRRPWPWRRRSRWPPSVSATTSGRGRPASTSPPGAGASGRPSCAPAAGRPGSWRSSTR